MTDWIEHDAGPQPVADDVWVEVQWATLEGGYPSRVPDEMEEASEIPWEGHKPRYRIINQHLIDAARLEGIRLGLMAADKAIEALVSTGDLHIEAEMALEEASIAICTLNSETIAKKAQHDF